MSEQPQALNVETGGVVLAAQESGEGRAVLLLHGLTATRRYVVMGSRALERSGHRVLAYDARGHGSSAPAPSREYGYEHLSADAVAVLDAAGVENAVLAGASMGAHTAARVALEHPDRVAALVLITPAYVPGEERSAAALAHFDALAAGLRSNGVEGFIDAYPLDEVPAQWRERLETVLRQRMSAHEHPAAVADALEVVPRSQPFHSLEQLRGLHVPTLVVGSRDDADPEHPLAVAERYAAEIPGARLLVEDAGPPARSPIAWQGGQLSQAIAELAAASVERP